MIHRDIKPQNIFLKKGSTGLSSPGFSPTASNKREQYDRLSGFTIKIGDFGLATESGELLSRNLSDEHEEDKVDEIGVDTENSSSAQEIKYSTSVAGRKERTTGIGTVSYASPEQLKGTTYDEKTDIYSRKLV